MAHIQMLIGQLRELARLYNIQITYDDAAGKKRHASRDALLAALRLRTQASALPDGDAMARALRDRKREIWSRCVEPVTVVWGKREPTIELFLPRDEGSLSYELMLESGEHLEGIRISAIASGITSSMPASSGSITMGLHRLFWIPEGGEAKDGMVCRLRRRRAVCGPASTNRGARKPSSSAKTLAPCLNTCRG